MRMRCLDSVKRLCSIPSPDTVASDGADVASALLRPCAIPGGERKSFIVETEERRERCSRLRRVSLGCDDASNCDAKREDWSRWGRKPGSTSGGRLASRQSCTRASMHSSSSRRCCVSTPPSCHATSFAAAHCAIARVGTFAARVGSLRLARTRLAIACVGTFAARTGSLRLLRTHRANASRMARRVVGVQRFCRQAKAAAP